VSILLSGTYSAKRDGVPLYQLLGGKVRDKVPVYATALYPEEPAQVARRARRFADQGFHGVKIKVGLTWIRTFVSCAQCVGSWVKISLL
jgi:L-alanine-DL-glutamate epimerase-like enolase superfamily enzyme